MNSPVKLTSQVQSNITSQTGEKASVQSTEVVVRMVSDRLREIVHDMNNALFITKGFIEELSEEVKEKKYLETNYDHENIADMVSIIARNADKVDENLTKLRKFSKEDIFDETGVTRV